MRGGRRGGWTGSIDLALLVLNLKGKRPLLHALDLRLAATEVEVSYLDRRRVRVTIWPQFSRLRRQSPSPYGGRRFTAVYR